MAVADFAVISDIHGNLEALDAVLADIEARETGSGGKRPVLFLGDAAGYGPNPNECIEKIRKVIFHGIAGNHDRAATGQTGISNFNLYAQESIRWTTGILSPENKAFLEGLPLVCQMEEEGLFLVHGSPYEPEKWHYLLYFSQASVNFEHFEEKVCLIGHSHLPFVMERSPSGQLIAYRDGADLDKAGCRYIINAGSVGQPRDGDPRACYLLLSGARAEFVRVSYDIEATQQKMRAAGLPTPLIERLQRGL